MAKSLGVPSVELRGGPLPGGEGWTREEDVYAGFARDLAADDDAELLAIPRKQRAEVRKALESGLTVTRSEEHTSELQSLMRISYAVFCLKKKNLKTHYQH